MRGSRARHRRPAQLLIRPAGEEEIGLQRSSRAWAIAKSPAQEGPILAAIKAKDALASSDEEEDVVVVVVSCCGCTEQEHAEEMPPGGACLSDSLVGSLPGGRNIPCMGKARPVGGRRPKTLPGGRSA